MHFFVAEQPAECGPCSQNQFPFKPRPFQNNSLQILYCCLVKVMETLRKLSHLSPQNFKPPGKTDKATVIRTDTYASKPLQHDRQQVPSHEVLNHLASLAAKNTGSQASLLIVTFPRDSRDYIYTTYELFMTLFNSFGIEPRLLDSLRLNRYGFYAENSNENVASYYICARRFTILWSFDAEKCATRGVMLIHQDNWLDSATQAFDNFMNIMTLEKNKIRSPILLTWCMLVDTMSWLDASIYAALNHARALERQTGHGPHAGASTGFDKSSDIDGLRQASQVVGKLVVVLTNLFRHVKICMEIASFLEEVIDQGSQYPTDEAQKMRLSELKHFAATIPEIRKKLDDAGTTLDYIQGRFNNQSSVVSASPLSNSCLINT
jgi:hypothetical protein